SGILDGGVGRRARSPAPGRLDRLERQAVEHAAALRVDDREGRGRIVVLRPVQAAARAELGQGQSVTVRPQQRVERARAVLQVRESLQRTVSHGTHRSQGACCKSAWAKPLMGARPDRLRIRGPGKGQSGSYVRAELFESAE